MSIRHTTLQVRLLPAHMSHTRNLVRVMLLLLLLVETIVAAELFIHAWAQVCASTLLLIRILIVGVASIQERIRVGTVVKEAG